MISISYEETVEKVYQSKEGKRIPPSLFRKFPEWMVQCKDLNSYFKRSRIDGHLTLSVPGAENFCKWILRNSIYNYPSREDLEKFSPHAINVTERGTYITAHATEWDSVEVSDALMASHSCFLSPEFESEVNGGPYMTIYKVVKV